MIAMLRMKAEDIIEEGNYYSRMCGWAMPTPGWLTALGDSARFAGRTAPCGRGSEAVCRVYNSSEPRPQGAVTRAATSPRTVKQPTPRMFAHCRFRTGSSVPKAETEPRAASGWHVGVFYIWCSYLEASWRPSWPPKVTQCCEDCQGGVQKSSSIRLIVSVARRRPDRTTHSIRKHGRLIPDPQHTGLWLH